MCNLSDGIEERATARGIARGIEQGMARGIEQGMARGRAQGIEQGMAQGTVQGILSLMDSLKLTVQDAMSALKIPQSEQGKYEAMIKQMNAK